MHIQRSAGDRRWLGRWLAGALVWLGIGLVGVSSAPPVAAEAPVTPQVEVFEEDGVAFFSIYIINHRFLETIELMDIKAAVPAGTVLLGSWAGPDPEQNPGVYTEEDQAIGWVATLGGDGYQMGPWSFAVLTGGQPVCTHVWVRVTAGPDGGEVVSDPVCTSPQSAAEPAEGTEQPDNSRPDD